MPKKSIVEFESANIRIIDQIIPILDKTTQLRAPLFITGETLAALVVIVAVIKTPRSIWSCRKEKGGLDFRDLYLFNLATLARQGWRLIMQPDSLCAQVLQAKYFPDGDILNVSEKPGISYSWRSTVRGLQAL
uniref:Uncharacterized protein n=1 Tax=Oryza brachyantha TaxID=4533 RepID=J3NCL6_ORYBR